MKGALPSNPPEQAACPPVESRSLVPKCMPQLAPTMLSLLKAIEPDTIYAGYDSSLPDTSTRLMTTLNRLGGRQVVSAVKWAKALPGEPSQELTLLYWLLEECDIHIFYHRAEKYFNNKCRNCISVHPKKVSEYLVFAVH